MGVCAIPEPAGQIAVLVPSCDKYADLWGPFFQLFRRFWPDCPFNVYLLSNTIRAEIPNVTNVLVGKDTSWSDSLRKAVCRLGEDYVFLFLDDLFLCDFVNSDKAGDVFAWILQCRPNYMRMNPSQKPDARFNNLVGLVSKKTIYRTSTVLSVWKKEILLDLLKPGESAWDFELYGSVRSDKYDEFYSTWWNHFPVINGVIKGKWYGPAVKKLKTLGAEVDLSARQIMTPLETTAFQLKRGRSAILNLFPARYRKRIKDFALGGQYNYGPLESKR